MNIPQINMTRRHAMTQVVAAGIVGGTALNQINTLYFDADASKIDLVGQQEENQPKERPTDSGTTANGDSNWRSIES